MILKRSLIVSIGFAMALLAGPMAWAQGNSKLANLKPRLDALKAFAEKLPPRHRNTLSGAVQNLISFADSLDRMPASLNNAAWHASGHATTSSGGGNSNVVQVSDPSTDFVFSLQTGFTQSETSTAWCGTNAVVGFNDTGSIIETINNSIFGDGLSSVGYGKSTNANATNPVFADKGALPAAHGAGLPSPTGGFLIGDPVVACTNASNFYFSNVGFSCQFLLFGG